jgi:hypothetical protein
MSQQIAKEKGLQRSLGNNRIRPALDEDGLGRRRPADLLPDSGGVEQLGVSGLDEEGSVGREAEGVRFGCPG